MPHGPPDAPGLAIRRVALDTLHLDPANAREHGPENKEAIVGSLKQFRQVEPLVVQKSSVIAGGPIDGTMSPERRLQKWVRC